MFRGRTELILLILWAPIVLASAACGGDVDGSREPSMGEHAHTIVDYYVADSLSALAAASDLVVIAEVHDVTREVVMLPSPVDPSLEARRGDVVVLAVIEAVVWGDAAGLSELRLQSAEWFEAPDPGDASQVARIDFPALPTPGEGETIVAFLRTDGGNVVPEAFAEVPGFGRLDGEMVTFPTIKLSSDALAPEITIPAATLDEIRDAMDRGAAAQRP